MRRLWAGLLLLIAVFAGGVQPALAAGVPAPGLEGQGQVVVTAPVLNVRAGPGTTYAIVNFVTGGSVLAVDGKDTTGQWLQVRTPAGTAGWVFGQFVSAGQAAAPSPAAPAGSPVRVVAPTIGLDSRVIPAGWHEVRAADGSVGADWDVPAYAAGWLITSTRPGEGGNVVLAGHHNIDGQVFRYVVNLNVGDPITVYTADKTYKYTVTDRMILPDKYVPYEQRVQNARWIGAFPEERLTLVTCWPYTNNTHRVIVVARPVAGQ